MINVISEKVNFYHILKTLFMVAILIFTVFSIYYLIHIGNKHVEDGKQLKIRRKDFLKIFYIAVILLVLVLLLYNYKILRIVFASTVLSAILALIFNPVVKWMEHRGMKRTTSVICLFLTLFVIVTFTVALIVPIVLSEVKNFAMNFSSYLNSAKEMMTNLFERLQLEQYGINIYDFDFQSLFGSKDIATQLRNGLQTMLSGVSSFPSRLLSLFLTIVMTFYILAEKDTLIRSVIGVIPAKFKEDVDSYKELTARVNQTIGDFIKGRIIMAAFVGVATGIFLLLMDVDFALIIGFVTFIADIIPYIGPFLGFLPAVFFAFLSSPVKAFVIACVFVALQWIENNVLGPKILGNRTGMHPLAVLLCIIVGGGMFGVLGMILSVPLVAVAYNVILFIVEKKKKNEMGE